MLFDDSQITMLVLGAGASRAVSYAHQGEMLSPLDSDFFDLLQRLAGRRKSRALRIPCSASRFPYR
jgi:hypothetical protein